MPQKWTGINEKKVIMSMKEAFIPWVIPKDEFFFKFTPEFMLEGR